MSPATPARLAYLRTRCRRYPWPFRSDRIRCVFPWIFTPEAYWNDPTNPWWDAVLIHEGVHLDQQSAGPRWVPVFLRLAWFLLCYCDRDYRLEFEAAGIAAEIDQAPHERKQAIFDSYVAELSTNSYNHAAPNSAAAAQAIRLALIERGCLWIPAR